MNLSQVTIDLQQEPEDNSEPRLRAEESRLVRIVEALQEVQSSKAWSSLKTEVFDNLVNVLEKGIKNEAKKEDPSPLKLNRLAGEVKWAERFSDLSKLENQYRGQLTNIRQQLHGKSDNQC